MMPPPPPPLMPGLSRGGLMALQTAMTLNNPMNRAMVAPPDASNISKYSFGDAVRLKHLSKSSKLREGPDRSVSYVNIEAGKAEKVTRKNSITMSTQTVERTSDDSDSQVSSSGELQDVETRLNSLDNADGQKLSDTSPEECDITLTEISPSNSTQSDSLSSVLSDPLSQTNVVPSSISPMAPYAPMFPHQMFPQYNMFSASSLGAQPAISMSGHVMPSSSVQSQVPSMYSSQSSHSGAPFMNHPASFYPHGFNMPYAYNSHQVGAVASTPAFAVPTTAGSSAATSTSITSVQGAPAHTPASNNS